MKRCMSVMWCAPLLVGWLGLAAGAAAQNNAAAVAAQEEAEDRYRRMADQVSRLKEAQDLHQQQIAALEKSIRELSDAVNRAHSTQQSATQEKIGLLAEQIRKVDEARVAENKKILETIEEIQRIIKNIAAAPPPTRHASPPPPVVTDKPGPSPNEEGFPYEVQKNDTLSGIVQAYRQQNIKVTRKAIMEANPNVNWDRLRIGQKIFIPKPKS